jgi:peptide/nickel transport system permease protein
LEGVGGVRGLIRNRYALAALIFILAMLVLAILAPLLARYDPTSTDSRSVLTAPSKEHIFGTDRLGRDIFSRIVYGARISLAIGFIAVGIASLIGVLIGAIAGYYGGPIDYMLMRFVDIMLCFPAIFLILAVISLLEPSITNIMVIIGATGWMGIARLVRAQVLTLKERDFISAARVMGAKDSRIILRHLIPNAIGPVLVSATLGIGGAILMDARLLGSRGGSRYFRGYSYFLRSCRITYLEKLCAIF